MPQGIAPLKCSAVLRHGDEELGVVAVSEALAGGRLVSRRIRWRLAMPRMVLCARTIARLTVGRVRHRQP